MYAVIRRYNGFVLLMVCILGPLYSAICVCNNIHLDSSMCVFKYVFKHVLYYSVLQDIQIGVFWGRCIQSKMYSEQGVYMCIFVYTSHAVSWTNCIQNLYTIRPEYSMKSIHKYTHVYILLRIHLTQNTSYSEYTDLYTL